MNAEAGGREIAPRSPTDALREEHERILEVIDAFERTVERAGRAEVGWATLEDFLVFFRLFVGACHHGKEEEVLFPALEAKGLSERTGPLAVMLEEHRRGRSLVAEMSRALVGAEGGDPAARVALAEAAGDYVDLIRRHIDKENPAILDAADHLISALACRALCEAYRSADRRGIEGRTAEDLRRLADDLLARAPRDRGGASGIA